MFSFHRVEIWEKRGATTLAWDIEKLGNEVGIEAKRSSSSGRAMIGTGGRHEKIAIG
jgi:hypothetical protein